ncbi:MAG: polysaccharide biosynthesis tyrosine autokinase [Phycisphaerales bacterium JB052]
MSSTPNTRPPMGPPRSAPGGSGNAPTFDPLKLLQKYKYLLVGAVVLGAVVGVMAHFFFLTFFPKFRSEVLFECSPVQNEIATIGSDQIDEDEMARFMGTQVENIKGELVRRAVLEDGRLAGEAPGWYKQYIKNGRFDVVQASEDIKKIIKANAIPNSYLIQLSVSVGDREDAAGLARLVQENYIRTVSSGTSSSVTQRKEQIRKAISDADAAIEELTNRKNRILEHQDIDTIDVKDSAEAEALNLVNAQIIGVQQQIEAYRVILSSDEAQLEKDTPIEYDSTLRDRVEQDPQILTLKQRVIDLESTLISLEQGGIGREHRSYKQALQSLDATKRQLETTREQKLLEAFESRIGATRMALSQFRAQIEDLSTQREELADRLNQLTKLTEEMTEINRQLDSALELKSEHQTNLSTINQNAGLETASRITVVKRANVPDRPSFPVLVIMVPLGVIFTTGLVGGALVVFEMLDQRVKSPADIALIPRTPILGLIPDAEEDPAKHESLATVFSDSPNSVLAEHYRQLRTKIAKKMGDHGHTTLLVVGAMPGSGATSVTTNLALACAATSKKVLVIDTNFRRARIHTEFGIQDHPGLAEVLAGESECSDAIQSLSNGLDIMPAGSRNLRVVERLGNEHMGQVLAEVSAKYDLVLLDVAPAIVAGDASTLAAQVDSTLLVARAMQEKRGQVARLKNELSDTRAEFLGVLVNGVRSSAGGYMRKNIRTSHKYHAEDAPQAI